MCIELKCGVSMQEFLAILITLSEIEYEVLQERALEELRRYGGRDNGCNNSEIK